MLRRVIISGLASLALAAGAWVQSTAAQSSPKSDEAKSDEAALAKAEEAIKQMPDKLREKLTAQGYSDVKIAPGSFIVSARDKDGHRVMMMIGPTSMTMLKVPDENPSQAQTPDDKDEIIQQ